ncbi:hypothetical protein DFH01_04950 [Falsiroseomonas bella]|uniref:SH3b domain-containing protein n=1 Tax=Falsiroseomonas bella TaxID=2184016 RepID=A0A317FHR2_9PROT|nr:SH3 domain-containing protein [Falsiroseomonas bella]PWS38624.1 hypothetical protein DFH01_04950 [Falsiroseomonas bella]
MQKIGAAAMLVLLVACDDPAPAAPRTEVPPALTEGRAAAAMQATEERLRTRLREEGALTLRAVQGYRQAMAEAYVVCGQVLPGSRRSEPYLPFVSIVTFEGERPAGVEFHLAATSAEATRVYYEMVDRCFDGGGPPNARTTVRPLPPAPSVQPGQPFTPPAAAAPPAPVPAPVAAAAPVSEALVAPTARGTVSVRSAANLRSHPGGEVLRVVPRGATLDVFEEAPGGWYRVGEGEPWGWVHGSLLEGR